MIYKKGDIVKNNKGEWVEVMCSKQSAGLTLVRGTGWSKLVYPTYLPKEKVLKCKI